MTQKQYISELTDMILDLEAKVKAMESTFKAMPEARELYEKNYGIMKQVQPHRVTVFSEKLNNIKD